METKQTSGFFKLDGEDFVKGLLLSVVSSVLTVVYQSLDAGSLNINWKNVGIAAATTGVAYLMKNLLTDAKTIVKVLLPLLLLSSACSAQSFFKPVPKIPQFYASPFYKSITVQKDSSITAFRPVAIAAAYGYESGSKSVIMAGSGFGLKRLTYDYATQKWKSNYSINALAWAVGTVSPSLVVPAFAIGLAVGVINDNVLLGGAWDFRNKQTLICISFSLPTNN